MESEIIYKIKTIEDQNRIREELELLKESLFEGGEHSFDATMHSNVRAFVAEIVEKEVSEKKMTKKDYLEELLKQIKNMEVMKVYLSFEPTLLTLEKFSKYVKANISKNIIMDINYDPNLIAGTKFIFKGLYKDFSYLKMFEANWHSNREQIKSLIAETNNG